MHFLNAVQVERLAEAIDARYRLLVLVGAYTGLRPGKITGLKVKRLDPDELDSLAERLEAVHERARAEAAATPARPGSAPTVAQIGEAAGH